MMPASLSNPGRTFIRRLIDLLKSAHHCPARGFIKLNIKAHSDILWWAQFITHWNGLSVMQKARRSNPGVAGADRKAHAPSN